MKNWPWFIVAAALEIGGCYAFWAWIRLGKSPMWLAPGLIALIGFAVVLTRVDTAFAGRAYAAYGGVYVISSLVWLSIVERASPLPSDYIGVALCIAGAAVILFGPRLSGA